MISQGEKNSVTIISWPISNPPNNGGENRMLSIIAAFVANGWKIHCIFVARGIPPEQSASWYGLKKMGVASVKIKLIGKVDHYLGKLFNGLKNCSFGFPEAFSPLLKTWIRRELKKNNSRLILTNHVQWTPLVVGHHGRQVAIDCVDICTLHRNQLSRIASFFPWEGWVIPQSSDLVLDEDCFVDYPTSSDLKTEIKILGKFDSILAISASEAYVISNFVMKNRIVTVPMCVDPVDIDNTYDGPAIFVGHNHPFNAQGYAYFVSRVLPIVVKEVPDFTFRVIGKDTTRFPGHPAAEIRGFVDYIIDEYRTAPFLIASMLGGTGQLTRVVEAMSCGLPVVASKAAARSSPIRHGVNGFITADADEMARHVITLHRDRLLARAMGHAARETVRAECSFVCMRDMVSRIFELK